MSFVFSNKALGSLIDTLLISDTTLWLDDEAAETFASPTGADVQRCILRDDTDDYEIIDIETNVGDGSFTITRARESTAAKEWPPGSILEQYLSKAVLESFQT